MAIIGFGHVQIPVMDFKALSYPKYPTGDPATYGTFSEACATEFSWDAHFAAYSCPSIERRLAGSEALALGPEMVLFVADVDAPNHQWSDDWWQIEQKKVWDLFHSKGRGYCYTSRDKTNSIGGGYRIAYAIEPFPLKSRTDVLRWKASHIDWLKTLAQFEIKADAVCSDWTRLYRLPRVKRGDIDVIPFEEIGDAERMLLWPQPLVAEDDPRCSFIETISVTTVSSPVSETNQLQAAKALAVKWPRQGRHVASLALCGALARAGWDEETIGHFVATVSELADTGNANLPKRLTQARDSISKVERGEPVSGWPSLAEWITSDTILDVQRTLGQIPAADLLRGAIANASGRLKDQLDEAAKEDGGGGDFRELLDKAAEALSVLIEAEETQDVTDVRPFGVRGREMRKRRLPPPEWLADNLILAKGLGAFSGEPKSGKSWDLTHITIALAAGRPVFNRFAVKEPIAVYYQYQEDPEESVNNRRDAIATGMGLDPDGEWLDNWYAQPRGRPFDVLNLADLCVLVASIWRFEKEDNRKIRYVALDPLSNIHSGEEDKRDSMKVVMARLHALETVLNASVQFAHHSGKEKENSSKRGGQKMRGSSAIHGAIDYGVYLSDLKGDSKKEFIAKIESEVKSARGGGIFQRTILIEDNDRGNAIKAVFVSNECKNEKQDEVQDLAPQRAVTIAQKLFDHGAPLTRDELERKVKGGKDIFTKAMEFAETEGWIMKRFSGGRHVGFEITNSGKDLIRNGTSSIASPSTFIRGLSANA